MLDLLCLGNVTIDDIVLSDGTTRPGCLGGDAIFAGLAARLWSDAVDIVAPVGRDFAPAKSERLRAAGFDPRGLPIRPHLTRHNRVTYTPDGSRTWEVLTPKNDFKHLSPVIADIPESFLATRFALLLAMNLDAQEQLVAGFGAHGVPVALDPLENYIAGNEARILRMLEGVQVFLPSELEVERLLGHRDWEQAARQFAERGCRVVAIKLGASGALIYDAAEDRFSRAPPMPAVVRDTTGAGDAFSGGFMAVYARTRDLAASTRAGLVASSFAIEDFGSSHLFDVTADQAENRMAALAERLDRHLGRCAN